MPSATTTRLVSAALLAGLALYLLNLLGHVGLGPILDDWLYMVMEGAAVLVVAWRAATVARDRLGWALLAGYLPVWWGGGPRWALPPRPGGEAAVSDLARAGLVPSLRPA